MLLFFVSLLGDEVIQKQSVNLRIVQCYDN